MTDLDILRMDVHQLKALYDKQALHLIDVRELEEWTEIRIPGAIHIPKGEIHNRIQTTVDDKEQNIYLHCRSGVRSLYAASVLLQLGYKNVYSIDGGIMDWYAVGYPVVVGTS